MRKSPTIYLLLLLGALVFASVWIWKGIPDKDQSRAEPSSVGGIESKEISPLKSPRPLSSINRGGTSGESLVRKVESRTTERVVIDDEAHHHVIRSWTGQLDPKILDIGKRFQKGELQSFSYPLFDGEEAVIEISRFKEIGTHTGTIVGRVTGQELSHVVITQVDDAEAGTIQMPQMGKFYEIRNGPEPGTVVFSEIDVEALGHCGVCSPSESSP